MMDELWELARAPGALFDRFLGEVQRIADDRTLAAPQGIARLQSLHAAMVREIEESVRRFRAQVGQAEARLVRVLRSPGPKPFQELPGAAQHPTRLIDLVARRLRGRRTCEDQPADAIAAGVPGRPGTARPGGDGTRRDRGRTPPPQGHRGQPAQAVLQLQAQPAAGWPTPAQRQAQADLEELERLKHQVTLATQVLASTLRVSGGIAVLGAGWRQGSRLRLDREKQARFRVLMLSGQHPAMAPWMGDVSRGGMHVGLPEALPPGGVVHLIVNHAAGWAGEVRVQGEVRWCRADGHAPGRFRVGVRVVADEGDQWAALLTRLAETRQDGRPVEELWRGGGPEASCGISPDRRRPQPAAPAASERRPRYPGRRRSRLLYLTPDEGAERKEGPKVQVQRGHGYVVGVANPCRSCGMPMWLGGKDARGRWNKVNLDGSPHVCDAPLTGLGQSPIQLPLPMPPPSPTTQYAPAAPRAPATQPVADPGRLWLERVMVAVALVAIVFLATLPRSGRNSPAGPQDQVAQAAGQPVAATPAGPGRAEAPRKDFFSIGFTEDDVMAVMGPPREIHENRWWYGSSFVDFRNGRVVNFSNGLHGELKVQMRSASRIRPPYLTKGLTKDEVLMLQGSPTRMVGDRWYYGSSSVDFRGDRVADYFNGVLRELKVFPRFGTQ